MNQTLEISQEIVKQQEGSMKIVLVGPMGSGKTSIIQQLMELEFNKDIKSTNCYEVSRKKLRIDNKEYNINLWDCGAYHDQSYRDVKKAFYKDCACVLIIVDVSKKDHTDQVNNWLMECYDFEKYQVFVILNKVDKLQPNLQSIAMHDAEMIQLRKDTLKDRSVDDLEELKQQFQQKNIRYYFGSVIENHPDTVPYKDLLIQLVRGILLLLKYFQTENETIFSSGRFQSNIIAAQELRKRLLGSQNLNSDSAFRLSNNNETKCQIF